MSRTFCTWAAGSASTALPARAFMTFWARKIERSPALVMYSSPVRSKTTTLTAEARTVSSCLVERVDGLVVEAALEHEGLRHGAALFDADLQGHGDSSLGLPKARVIMACGGRPRASSG